VQLSTGALNLMASKVLFSQRVPFLAAKPLWLGA
jgi:hypothetical protein